MLPFKQPKPFASSSIYLRHSKLKSYFRQKNTPHLASGLSIATPSQSSRTSILPRVKVESRSNKPLPKLSKDNSMFYDEQNESALASLSTQSRGRVGRNNSRINTNTIEDQNSFEENPETKRGRSTLSIKVNTEGQDFNHLAVTKPNVNIQPIEIVSRNELYVENFSLEDVKRPSKDQDYEQMMKLIYNPNTIRPKSNKRTFKQQETIQMRNILFERQSRNSGKRILPEIAKARNPSTPNVLLSEIVKDRDTSNNKKNTLKRQSPSPELDRQSKKSPRDRKMQTLRKCLLNQNYLGSSALEISMTTEEETRSSLEISSARKIKQAIEDNKGTNLELYLKIKLKQEEIRKKHIISLISSIYKGRASTIFIPYPTSCYKKNDFERCQQYELLEDDMVPRFICHTKCPTVIRVLENAGLEEMESEEFSVIWGKVPTREMLDGMSPWQKINHYPGSRNLGRKDYLWRNFNRMKQKFPNEYSYMPQTYVLDTDDHIFINKLQSARNDALWILKPAASSCGNGIKLIHKYSRIPRKKNLVVSDYIANPHLIYNLKYDLRIYVLVSSMDPLRIYIYDEGLARFATQDYSCDAETLKEKFAHLTNYSLNKASPNYCANKDINEEEFSNKWSLKNLRKVYQELGIDYNEIMDQIKDIAIKTLISVEPYMLDGANRSYSNQKKCFELYGFDILIDSNLKAWLLEVNICPSLNTDSPLDDMIKQSLLCDTFNLIGLKTGSLEKTRNKMANVLQRFNKKFVKALENLNNDNCLEVLSVEDWEILFEAQEELHRKGNFKLIFPLKENVEIYRNLFEVERYNNVLLWKYKTSETDLLRNVTHLAFGGNMEANCKTFMGEDE